MRVLFIHQNFPAQFRHLAPALAARGDDVKALAITPRAQLPGVQVVTYQVARGNTQGIHRWAHDFESKVIRAEACARAMLELKRGGYTPDLVIAHPGWGESWLVKDVFPSAPLLAFQEFYYGADSAFDPEFSRPDLDARARTRVKNANVGVGLDTMDWGLSPTEWQRSQFPPHHRAKISVIFDGIDTAHHAPDADAAFPIPSADLTLRPGDEVVTFVNRNLEPHRGYHSFMRALPALFSRRPTARVVIVGGTDAGYGAAPPQGTWRDIFLKEVEAHIDRSRVHFLGRVPHDTLTALFRVSRCHVYLTYPFVLSWSMIEAMSVGCAVVGAKIGPVEEVIRDGENGFLVDFFAYESIAERIAQVLAGGPEVETVRRVARQTVVERYDLRSVCLPKQLALVDDVAHGRTVAPV